MGELPEGLGNILAAITALGLASFALVDAFKLLPFGGVSYVGFARIRALVNRLLSDADRKGPMGVAEQLLAIWVSGKALADQKAVAKSLLKLNPENADRFAKLTEVDAETLKTVAAKVQTGAALSEAELTVMGRFDLALTALIDAAYLRADQRYRNGTRALACVVAVLLAVAGGIALGGTQVLHNETELLKLVLAGLFATPLAPLSKDLTSALAAGVKLAQMIKR